MCRGESGVHRWCRGYVGGQYGRVTLEGAMMGVDRRLRVSVLN